MAVISDIVRPGDVITSDLLNRMIALLNQHDAAIGAGGASQSLVVTTPVDGAQFRVGEFLLIEGQNFGFTQGTTVVSIDGIRATQFQPGSTDERLTVKIPGIDVTTADGRDVLLVVSNGTASAVRSIRIRPASDLAGAVDVTWLGLDPNPIVASNAVLFEFLLKSRTNLDASYLVTPTVSNVANANAWNAASAVLLQGVEIASRSIPVAAGAERRVQVRISPVPNVAQGTTFSLAVAGTSGAVVGTTGRLRLAVGTNITFPDPDISVSISTVEFFPPGSGSFEPVTEAIQVQRTATGRITLVAHVKQAGDYAGSIAAISSPGSPTSNWTLVRHPQDPADPGNPSNSLFSVTQAQVDAAGSQGVPIAPRFNVTPQQSASELGEAEVRLERKNSGKSNARVVSLSTS